MGKLKLVLNREGVRELLRSEAMTAMCRERADAAAARLGDGYSVNTCVGRNRVNAEIRAESYEAQRENLEHNTILKALL